MQPGNASAIRVATWSAAVAAVLALVSLSGWILGLDILTRFVPTFATQKPNTSLAIILAAAAVWLGSRGRHGWANWAANACATAVFLLAALSLVEALSGKDFGIDDWGLGGATAAAGSDSMQMPSSTSLTLVLIAISLLLRGSSNPRVAQVRQVAAAAAIVAAIPGLAGYSFGVESLYRVPAFYSVAIHTPVCLSLLGLAALVSSPSDAVVQLLFSGSAGGTLARRILPAAILIPWVMAGVCGLGVRFGLYDDVFDRGLFVTATIVVICAVVWTTAQRVNREDAARRMAHAVAQELATRLSTTLRSIGDAVITTDQHGRVTYLNPTAEDLTGWQTSDAREKWLDEIFVIRDEMTGEPRELPTKAAIAEGRVVELEDHTVLESRSGARIAIEDSAAPIRSETGAIHGAVLVVHDVTARRKLQLEREMLASELSRSNDRFRLAADASESIIYEWDLTLGSRFTLGATEKVLGMEAQDVPRVGTWWFARIHPDDRDAARNRIMDGIGGPGSYACGYRIRGRDGDWRQLWDRGTAVRDGSGTVVRVVGNASDVTEIRKLEEDLIQARRLESVGRLAGGISHDFNNLITVILGSLHLAIPRLRELPELRAELERAEHAAERAASLTGKLLAFSRRHVVDPRVVDLNVMVGEAESMLRRVFPENVTVRVSVAPNLWRVSVDPTQFENVILNMALNARDAMPDGGTLTLSTRNVTVGNDRQGAPPEIRRGDFVVLSIADTGSGIPPEVLPRIFEPFFTTKGPGQGTGLGLASAYGAVKQAGGHVTVQSQPGRGATFEVYVPRHQGAEVSAATKAPPPPTVGGRETVLVVEDEELVRQTVVRLLQHLGYDPLVASSFQEAMTIARSEPRTIQLLLTDVLMADANGQALAQAVRLQRPGIRVLYMSGYSADVIRSGDLDGGSGFLQKPFTTDDLGRGIRAVLDAPGPRVVSDSGGVAAS